MKKCKICNRVLPETEFYPKPKSKDGLRCDCKECTRRINGISRAEKRGGNNMVVSLEGEIWKDIEEFNGDYQISNKGRVKSKMFAKNGTYSKGEKILTSTISEEDGYEKIAINRNGKTKKRSIHRLMAIAFIPNPNNLPEVNHIDTIKTNNSLENFEWITRLGNMQHANKMGRIAKYTHHKINEDQARELKKRISLGENLKSLSLEYGLAHRTIYQIKENKRWGWVQ